jgi:hypothetical protein
VQQAQHDHDQTVVHGKSSREGRVGGERRGARRCALATAFATFDMLAGAERRPADVIPVVQRLCRLAISAGPPA